MKFQKFGYALVAFLLLGCNVLNPTARRPRPTTTAPLDWPMQAQQQLSEFDTMLRSLRSLYIDPTKVDAVWQQKADAVRAKFKETTTAEEYASYVRDLLATINDPNIQLGAIPDDSTVPAVNPEFAGGLGVQVDLPSPGHERVLILAVSDASAGQTAGIKSHDAIIAVDGRPVGTDPAVLLRVRGRVGSQVVISVKTPGKAQRDVTVIRRAVAVVSPTNGRILQGTNYGYIQPGLATPPDQLRGEVTAQLRELSKNRQLDGLILDLRVMRGLDFPTEDLLALFVNNSVALKYQRGQVPNPLNRSSTAAAKVDIAGRNIAGSQTVPLVILVSSLTNGQAEAFAGLLQDLQRAVIVGNRTPGNVALLADVDLPLSGLRLRVPNAEYRPLSGTGWNKVGITPNTLTETQWEDYTDDNDPVLKLSLDQLNRGKS